MKRALLIALATIALSGCWTPTDCADGGTDGGPDAGCFPSFGAGGGGTGTFDPGSDAAWNLVLESFSATVSVSGLSVADPYCTVSGGALTATFAPQAGQVGRVIGQMDYTGPANGGPSGGISIEVQTDSSTTQAARSGMESGSGPVACAATADTDSGFYAMTGAFRAATGAITVSATMPLSPGTGGNIVCLPSGDRGCDVRYWHPNDPTTLRSDPFDLAELLSGRSVTISFTNTATNASVPGEVRTGQFSWTGSLRLHAVPTSP